MSYDAEREAFSLTPEQSLALAQEGSPAFVPGAFQLATALIKDEEKIAAAFRDGDGVGWHEHHHDLFAGTERFFRPGYAANLITSVDPGPARRPGQARVRGAGRRRRLRPWGLDDPHGPGVSPLDVRRFRLPRARRSSRPGASAAEAGLGGPGQLRGRHGQGIPGSGYDLVADVRLPARHGRSGRGGRPRARDARAQTAPG